MSVARKCDTRAGVDTDDLFGAGMQGLATAIDRFDPDRGFRFSTYAPFWIRQSVVREIENTARPVRLPAHVVQSINRVNRTTSTFLAANGREPTHKELSELCDIEADRLDSLQRSHTLTYHPVSLDAPRHEDGRDGRSDARTGHAINTKLLVC